MASSVPIVSTSSGEKSVACPLNVSDSAFDDSVKEIIISAESRWLKNEEVHKLLDSVQEQVAHVTWPQEPAEKPKGGRLFMFSRRVCRGFRNDRHSWRKKQGACMYVHVCVCKRGGGGSCCLPSLSFYQN